MRGRNEQFIECYPKIFIRADIIYIRNARGLFFFTECVALFRIL